MKIGEEFLVCNPFMGWSTSGGSVRVWLSLHYGHFKIKKVNEKSFLVDAIKEIGCGWSSKWSMDETYTKRFKTKQEIIDKIKIAIPLRIEEMNEVIIRFTEFAPEYHFGKAKINFLKEFLELANKGLQETDIEKFNDKWNKETNLVEIKVKELLQGEL